MSIRLSLDRQLPLFEKFASAESISEEEAQTLNQGTLRSLGVRGWIRKAGRRFIITREGKEAWEDARVAKIYRSEAQCTRPLSAYFDPDAYALKVVHRKKKVA